MGPAYFNEYEVRSDYYGSWLKEQLGKNGIPDDSEAKHRMIIKLRQEAYKKLCDAVYREKGYTPDAVPLPSTLERFGLLDDKALAILREFSLDKIEKLTSKK